MAPELEGEEEARERNILFLSVCDLGWGERSGRLWVLCLAGGGMMRSISGGGLGLCVGRGEWVGLGGHGGGG